MILKFKIKLNKKY